VLALREEQAIFDEGGEAIQIGEEKREGFGE